MRAALSCCVVALLGACTLLSAPADFRAPGQSRDGGTDGPGDDGDVTPPRTRYVETCAAGKKCMGETCTASGSDGNAACASGNCADLRALRLRTTNDAQAGVCTRACCSDWDCPADHVCWDSGSGAKLCAEPALLGISVGAATDACANDADCASGTCAYGLCVSACSADADCPDGTGCGQFEDFGQSILTNGAAANYDFFTLLACVPEGEAEFEPVEANRGPRNLPEGADCEHANECASRLCTSIESEEKQRCRRPCGDTSDCANGQLCQQVMPWDEQVRAYVSAVTPDPALNPTWDYVTVCGAPYAGAAALGAVCSVDDDCSTDICVNNKSTPGNDTDKWCAPICCNDSTCTALEPSLRCVPVLLADGGGTTFAGHWRMTCGK